MQTKSMHLPKEIREFRQFLCSAILREYPMPTIEPVDAEYEYGAGVSTFMVKDSFTAMYVVSITKVSNNGMFTKVPNNG